MSPIVVAGLGSDSVFVVQMLTHGLDVPGWKMALLAFHGGVLLHTFAHSGGKSAFGL